MEEFCECEFGVLGGVEGRVVGIGLKIKGGSIFQLVACVTIRTLQVLQW